jgi:hypothetical protein
MDACCDTKAEELKALRDEHRKVLIPSSGDQRCIFIVEAIARQKLKSESGTVA